MIFYKYADSLKNDGVDTILEVDLKLVVLNLLLKRSLFKDTKRNQAFYSF